MTDPSDPTQPTPAAVPSAEPSNEPTGAVPPTATGEAGAPPPPSGWAPAAPVGPTPPAAAAPVGSDATKPTIGRTIAILVAVGAFVIGGLLGALLTAALRGDDGRGDRFGFPERGRNGSEQMPMMPGDGQMGPRGGGRFGAPDPDDRPGRRTPDTTAPSTTSPSTTPSSSSNGA